MSAAKRQRGAWATVLGTLLIVVLEFLLLTGVYHSDDAADRRHEASVRVVAVLSAWQPASGTTSLNRAVDQLVATGMPGAHFLQVRTRIWAEDPTLAGLGPVRSLSAHLDRVSAADQTAADRRVGMIHASLLIAVSVGWFFWFRRLVARQRSMQRTLTEAQVAMAGERRLTALVQNSADMVAVLDPDSTLSFVSPAAWDVLGRAPEELVGHRFAELLRPDDVPVLVGMMARSSEGDQQVTLRTAHADGRELAVEGTLSNLVADPAVGGWVLTVRDVTDRLAMQEELSHQAFHDSLTGLANRRLFGERLAHALRARGRQTEPVMVLFLDLDDFKNVNDSEGHGTGDRLLVTVAERISATIRQGDTAARLGGDEFAVLMEDADEASAYAVAERLLQTLVQPITLDDAQHLVRASIGIAQAEPGETLAEEALRNADVAMYWAKERGKGTIAVYDASLHATALERLALRTELQLAIREGQLVVHYQPTVDLSTRQISGFEALVRWQHPTRGLVGPDDFVPIAEQSGLIVPLGSWVLVEACRAGVVLQDSRQQPSMSVNVSTRQLVRPDFVEEVFAVLDRTGMPPQRLVLEITESALLDDRERVVQALSRLRARGLRVAIDDFGTGYSSLAYLADLPVDVLKLDKAFVDTVGQTGGGSLAETIIAMGHTLNLTLVAEGVERPEQARWLQQAKCALGQGFLWSKAVDLATAQRLLADGAAPHEVPPGPNGESGEAVLVRS